MTPCPVPRWLHAWAVLTALFALPLALLGAEVTTKQVGMVDKESVRSPLHLLTASSDDLWGKGVGYVIEHSHRFFGWCVGLCAVVLAVGMAACVRHRRARWLGVLALLLVSAQGILGIFRVRYHVHFGPNLAMLHGLFAQVVFACLAGVAVLTSPAWWQPLAERDLSGPRRLAALLLALTFAQIVFGASIRHFQDRLAQRLHFLGAFAVVAASAWLVRGLWEKRLSRRAAGLLVGLLAVQLVLGVEAWLRRFGSGVSAYEAPPPSWTADLIRSTHFVVGALLFVTAAALNLLLYRPAVPVVIEPTPLRRERDERVAVEGIA
jgi:cytochrome c oxidase assembly protein subunit 15